MARQRQTRGMAESSDVIFDRGLDVFGSVVTQLSDDDWNKPSPCEGWTALDVLGHLGTSMAMGTSILKGEQPTWPQVERPADVVDGEPLDYWRSLTTEIRPLLEDVDLDEERDTPMGRRTVGEGLAFPAIDLYVHAWDVGRAAGIDVEIPTEAIEFAHTYIDPLPEEMVRGEKGAFAPQAEAPDDATDTEQFIAWTGRAPR